MTVLLATGTLSACSLAKVASLELQPMTGFETHRVNAQVLYEPAARAAADAVVAGLGAAVRQIETTHGERIERMPTIYICDSLECHRRYAFAQQSAAETRPLGQTVLLHGTRLLNEQRLEPVLTHELSHVFWYQRGIRCQPRWWSEGLAVSTSGGGGAEKASVEAAARAVRDGHVFADLLESCWIRDSAPRSGLEWPMFYRQAGMYVDFLRQTDPSAFARALQQLRDGAGLSVAIETSYGRSVYDLWTAWQNTVKAAAR